MYFANARSKVVHIAGCGYVNRISDLNLEGFDYISDAMDKGFRFCKCCGDMTSRIQAHEPELKTYCKRKGFRCRFNDDELSINTPFSQWKVYVGKDGNYDLYHRNTRGNTADYHLQRQGMNDLMGILRYIDSHNIYRKDNPLPKSKKKSAPKKGTKRYERAMYQAKERKRRAEINRVLKLIDSLAMA